MHESRFAQIKLILILGLLSMLMPLAIDMYLPSLPSIAHEFSVDAGRVQLTLSSYVLGFAIGQLFYGPLSDSIGRKPVIVGGTLIFAIVGMACALSQTIEQLTYMRFLHGLSAAAASVVINALIRDLFEKEDFSRVMSFVTLVMIIGPLIAPMLGGALLLFFSWHAIFWSIAIIALLATILVIFYTKETLLREKRKRFHAKTIIWNFITLMRHKQALCYMLSSAFCFAGMFSFLSLGSFVYIKLYGISPQHFGYYFAINIIFIFCMTLINSKYVKHRGAVSMLRFGLFFQFLAGVFLLVSEAFHLGFFPLVLGIACFVGCVSMITSNSMAIILSDFPHMAGTAASLAGTLRFGVGALVGGVLSKTTSQSAWPMVLSMFLCVSTALILFFYNMTIQQKSVLK